MTYYLPYHLTRVSSDNAYSRVSRPTYNRIKKRLKDKHIIFSETCVFGEKFLDLSDDAIYDFYFNK